MAKVSTNARKGNHIRGAFRSIAVRIQPDVGRAVDVSALSELDVIHALNVAQDREPALLREASADVPPGAAYLLLERFCQLYEATDGHPFSWKGQQ